MGWGAAPPIDLLLFFLRVGFPSLLPQFDACVVVKQARKKRLLKTLNGWLALSWCAFVWM